MDTVIHTYNEKTLPETDNVIDMRGVNNMKVFHCTVCGQLKPLTKEGQKYCGINCNMRAYRERKKKSQWKICAFCSEGFIPSRSDQKCCKKSHRVALCRQLKKLDAQP